MDNYIEGTTTIQTKNLKELDDQISLSEDNLLQMKKIMGDKLEYDLDCDYKKLTVTINIKVEPSDNDESERNSQLN